MAEHIKEWLEAYHDGELRGARLHQVERHLAGCAECRAELETARGLSTLLHDAAPVGDFIPAEKFSANLALNLPRQPQQPQPRRWLEVGWQLIPVGLLGIWLFIQITFALSGATQLAVNSGIFNGHLSWLQGQPVQMEWFASTMNLFGGWLGAPGREVLSAANSVDLFVTQAVKPYIWQAFLAVLYLGWFVSWWLRYQSPPPQNAGSFPRS